MMLRVRDVVKNYGGLCAMAGASLDVPRRTTIALVGPNGCGKTSLLKTIFGLQRADEGSIYFEGESIDDLQPNEVFKRGIVEPVCAGAGQANGNLHQRLCTALRRQHQCDAERIRDGAGAV